MGRGHDDERAVTGAGGCFEESREILPRRGGILVRAYPSRCTHDFLAEPEEGHVPEDRSTETQSGVAVRVTSPC